MEQVFAEFGQLAGAQERAVVDDIGRVAFGVAMLLRVRVQHELRQCAVQTGDFALHQAEARAGQFGRFFKIQAQRGTQIHMVFDVEIERARRAYFADFHVFGFVFAHGHAFVRQVGDAQQQVVQSSLHLRQFALDVFQVGFQLGDLGFGGFGFVFFALPHQHADLFGQAVALRLQFFAADLELFALAFQFAETLGVQHEAALGQALGGGLDVVAQ